MHLEKLVAQGEKALEEFQPELALKFFKRALEIENQNASSAGRVLDLTGETLVAVGEPEEALRHFLKSSQVAPNENPYKWLYLGQLQEGAESLECFRKGIAMLGALKQEQVDADFAFDELRSGLVMWIQPQAIHAKPPNMSPIEHPLMSLLKGVLPNLDAALQF